MIVDMPFVKWKLEQVLENYDVTRYALAQVMANERVHVKSRMTQLYRMREQPARLDMQALADIIQGLRDLTGQKVSVADLLEFQDEQTPLFDDTTGSAA